MAAKVAQQKEKDFESIKANISFTDMSDEQQEKVFEICRNAYSKYTKTLQISYTANWFGIHPGMQSLDCCLTGINTLW